MKRGKHVVAVYRNPAYSPLQHLSNDTAIMDATAARLLECGFRLTKTTEVDVASGRLPDGDLYLNMCQGSLAAEQLMPLEGDSVVVVNRPSSVLNCHRHRLVRRLAGTTLSFPHTVVLPSGARPTADQLRELDNGDERIWVKRGDVHAERPEDVVAVARDQVLPTMRTFAERGIPWVALQQHVSGPLVKFYAVGDGRFFRWYANGDGRGAERPAIDEDRLKALAFDAAALLGLEVFGGDVAFPRLDRPVLIDINDWPSFAPFRAEAAQAIAAYVTERMNGRVK
ncbi:MAG TPA: hypothetical protein VFK78_09470 [Gemmatimonadales bacterium]|nr:hypothetical protein [Gemmatimonadales bacterium]